MRDIVQETLDHALASEGVFSYWNKKAETKEEDPREYIVYRKSGEDPLLSADNQRFASLSSMTVIYYYQDALLESSGGRAKVKKREETIRIALKEAGFSSRSFDGGQIADNGYESIIFECEAIRIEN